MNIPWRAIPKNKAKREHNSKDYKEAKPNEKGKILYKSKTQSKTHEDEHDINSLKANEKL